MIGNFFNDEAAEWYITTIRKNEKISFDELKMSFLKRFDIKLVDPLIEFCRLRYDSNKGIRHYFEKKRDLGMSAELTKTQIITLLVDGLLPSMSSFFTTIKPSSMDESCNIARQT